MIDDIKELKVASDYRDRMRIRCSDVYQKTGNLSGGNQQKVVLSKWLFTDPEVLILDEPTRGIDVGAKYEIYWIINELAEAGKGVVVISSEMPELLGICDRIYVMNEGAFVGEFAAAEATQEKIMRAIMRNEGVKNGTRAERGADGSSAAMTDKTVSLPEERRHGGFIKNNLRDYGMLLSLFAIMLFFQVMTDGTLLQPLNLTNLVLQNSYIVIMALGMLLVIVAGHIDLSVGSVAGFVGAVAAVLMVRYQRRLSARPSSPACSSARLIGAAQGYWVAYFKIPSFIVTLAGMLVFKGLALALLQGQSVGPFPATFQKLSSGFIPELLPDAGTLHPTSLLIGIVLALALVYASAKSRAREQSHGIEVEPYAFFLAKNVVLAGAVLYFTYLIASHRGLPNVLVIMTALIALYGFVTRRTVDRPADLRGRRQREGGEAVGHQDRAADLPHLRQHGRAGRARRPGLRRAPQHRDAEGRHRLRARRHRRLLHRRRLGLWRRRPGRRRGDRRLDHGRDEQRHVDPRHRHRLPAGDQGPGAARRRVHRRLQPAQIERGRNNDSNLRKTISRCLSRRADHLRRSR